MLLNKFEKAGARELAFEICIANGVIFHCQSLTCTQVKCTAQVDQPTVTDEQARGGATRSLASSSSFRFRHARSSSFHNRNLSLNVDLMNFKISCVEVF